MLVRIGGEGTVGERGVAAGCDFHFQGELGERAHLRTCVEIDGAVRTAPGEFGEHGETAESVAPVADPFTAVAVICNTLEKIG